MQELCFFLIAPVSFFGFTLICKKVRYGTPRSACVLLWGFVHLIPILVFTAIDIDMLKQTIGTFSLIYLLMMGAVLSVIAFVREPWKRGEYFADGPNWPT